MLAVLPKVQAATSFLEVCQSYSPAEVSARIARQDKIAVEQALMRAGRGGLEDFMALLSPAAEAYLPDLAAESQRLTRKRFGNTVKFFIPVYISNECQNICTYCGFSYTNSINRTTLTHSEVLKEIAVLKNQGFAKVLILSGEHNRLVGMDYLRTILPLFVEHFSEVSIEMQPFTQAQYGELKQLGLAGVTVYQETYDPTLYQLYHPRGKKSNYAYRLATPERAGASGVHQLGIGALLGLADWRTDSFFTALHYQYLKQRFWQCEFTISFPRLRPAEAVNVSAHKQHVKRFPNERDLAQLIFAYRLFDEDLGLSLSTRERAQFRDFIIPNGITTISAGSTTNPGGYACYPAKSLEQFSVEDTRAPAEMAAQVEKLGLAPVFKDWMAEFNP